MSGKDDARKRWEEEKLNPHRERFGDKSLHQTRCAGETFVGKPKTIPAVLTQLMKEFRGNRALPIPGRQIRHDMLFDKTLKARQIFSYCCRDRKIHFLFLSS